MITYLLQVAICWGLFLGLYHLTLRKETFFAVNRVYLLLTIVLGLLIPRITWDTSMFMEQPTIEMAVGYMSVGIEQMTSIVSPEVETPSMGIIAMIYWLGVVFMIGKLLYGIGRIAWMRHRAEKIKEGNQAIAYTNRDHAPFTFFGTIYLSIVRNDQDNDPAILIHESAHVSGWHTLDVLFVELVKAFFWFNPLVYGYDHALKTIHEYIADANVLQRTALQRYGRLLLRQAQPGLEIALANHFYNHQLKKRFKMMTRTPSQKRMLLKYLSVLPFILVISLVFTNQMVQAEISKVEEIDFSTLLDSRDNIEQEIDRLLGIYQNQIYANAMANYIAIAPDMHNLLQELKEHELLKIGNYINSKSDELSLPILINISEGTAWVGFLILNETTYYFPADHLKGITAAANGEVINFNREEVIMMKESEFPNTTFIDSTSIPEYPTLIISNEYGQGKLITDTLPIYNLENGEKSYYILTRPEQYDLSNDTLIEYDPNTFEEIQKVWKKPESLNPKTAREVFKIVEEMPEFPGGWGALADYASQNTQYPEIAKQNNTQGLAVITFIVNKDGSLSDFTIKDDPGNGTGQEALRIALKMSKEFQWSPGKQKGKKVDVEMSMPVLFILSPTFEITEEASIKATNKNEITESQSTSEFGEVFHEVEEMPQFPGGQEALTKYIQDNLVYPKESKAKNIQGEVLVEFVVNEDGSMSYFRALRGPDDATHNQALLLLAKMSREIKWIPGKHRNKKVRVQMKLPILFALSDDYVAPKEEIIERIAIGKAEKDDRGLWWQVDTVFTYYPERFEEEITITRTELHGPPNVIAQSEDDNNPLIVLYDKKGTELYRLTLNDKIEITANIDPNDIKHINVLKGKKATDLFGNRGKEGVIQIYLKKVSKKSLIKKNKERKDNNTPDQKNHDISDSNSTLINEMNFKSISLLPNPVTDELTVDLVGVSQTTKVMISTIDGKELYQDLILKTNGLNERDINSMHDISNLPSGVLIVSIIQGDKIYSQPIVKK